MNRPDAVSMERLTETNGITICYETLGEPANPALLLIMGAGVQKIEWDPEFIRSFERAGFYVIWFDNRDCGRSSQVETDYDLFDMADDAFGLLDALGIAAAHVMGTSLGGMIAQSMAITHPSRVLSLCSIMSSTGARDVGRPSDELRRGFVVARGTGRTDYVEDTIAQARLVNGSKYPLDETELKWRASAAYDRAYFPQGRLRHVAAIGRSGDRTDSLRSLRMPTVVIHGSDDPLVTESGGRATANAISDARLVILEGMGHFIPRELRSLIVQEVVANARRAQVSLLRLPGH